MKGLTHFDLFQGRKIGSGSSRFVYEHTKDPSVVIKVCRPGDWSNVREWEAWYRMRYCEFISRWLAPCVHLSPCGTVLIQSRTVPLDDEDPGPRLVPNWLTDFKRSNWGTLGENYVCHDYASHLMMEKGATRRLMKPVWRTDAP